MINKISRIAAVFALLGVTAACTSAETEQRLSDLETKVNRALQASSAAKIDAATALMVAEEKK